MMLLFPVVPIPKLMISACAACALRTFPLFLNPDVNRQEVRRLTDHWRYIPEIFLSEFPERIPAGGSVLHVGFY